MAKSNSNEFEQLRIYVQYFTMGSAVLCVIVWLISLIPNNDFQTAHVLLKILSGATEIGGTVMGVLYLIHRSRER